MIAAACLPSRGTCLTETYTVYDLDVGDRRRDRPRRAEPLPGYGLSRAGRGCLSAASASPSPLRRVLIDLAVFPGAGVPAALEHAVTAGRPGHASIRAQTANSTAARAASHSGQQEHAHAIPAMRPATAAPEWRGTIARFFLPWPPGAEDTTAACPSDVSVGASARTQRGMSGHSHHPPRCRQTQAVVPGIRPRAARKYRPGFQKPRQEGRFGQGHRSPGPRPATIPAAVPAATLLHRCTRCAGARRREGGP